MNLPEEAEIGRPLSKERVSGFDGLRGAAVLAVLLHHLSDYCPVNSFLAVRLKTLLYAGWCGVDLFFVLSGFLITGILLDAPKTKNYFRSFYARRALRILPVYYATLITVLLAARFTPVLDAVLPASRDRLFYFVFLNNWWVLMQGSWHANVIGHFWSLAVEEQFYLLWPLIPWLFSRKNVTLMAACGVVLAPMIRVAVFAHWGPVRDIVENPFCRMDSLLMGAVLAGIVRCPKEIKRWMPLLYCSALAAAGMIVAAYFSELPALRLAASELFIFSLLASLFGGLVLYVFMNRNSLTKAQCIVRLPALRFCGKYSYGMYVYHVPLLWLLARYATGSQPLQSLPVFLVFSCAVMAVTVAVAKLSFDCFERRFLNLRPRT